MGLGGKVKEIKFRFWDKEFKRFSETPQNYKIFDINNYTDYEVNQYTGIKDFYGKEIYEGDIIGKNIVVWSEKYLGWFLKQFKDKFENDLFPLSDLETIYIKGNIYENIELLED